EGLPPAERVARRALEGGGGLPSHGRDAPLPGIPLRVKNVAASVRARLLNLAKERREDFQFVLIRFGIERFLYRLSRSPHADVFVLKGAQLYTIWSASPHRATKDVDMLGSGEPDPER